MGTWPSIRLAFILGSLFMSLLIIVYWENILRLDAGSVPILYGPLHTGWNNRTNKDPSQPVNTSRSEATVPTTTHIPVQQDEEGQHWEEEELEVKQERRKEETLEGNEKESSGVSAEDMEQKARKQRIMDVCSEMSSSEEFPAMKRSFNQIPNMELDHFIVDDKHQIIYCYVPKVACSNWKRMMMILSESQISPSSGKPYTDPVEIPTNIVHNGSNYLTFDKFPSIYGSLSHHLMAVKLQKYTKFLFVRDPFVRLISAFRNKFGKPNQVFYKRFGSVILRRYGGVSYLPDTAKEAFAAGLKPTFQQFITYLLDPQTERRELFNEHWRQIYRLCHPCQVKYDFIGRLETLDTDAEQVLKLMKVDNLLHFPSAYQNLTVVSWVRDWFEQIPFEARRKLYKLYEPDFKLFGYPKPDSVVDE
ncbi:carbohydrate sulfotransferase 12-like [Salarias fasciatus]|uniref:Carbohydrate sulfotransferase n=1 Tax=Salarias fasciatus TaxID=181472 RepID=A0A672GCU8_SALFA|nr:carbohydrate sulfotransferase 12-like [Salarias fasciatus]